jgi:hypothetical protein
MRLSPDTFSMRIVFLLLVFSGSAFALDNKMLAKDLWVKKHVPIIAHDLCEGRIATCMGGFTDDCAAVYQPAVQQCADQMYDTYPEYFSTKEVTKKYSQQISACAQPKVTDQVVRKIMANAKLRRKEKCLELAAPKAPAAGGPRRLTLPGAAH